MRLLACALLAVAGLSARSPAAHAADGHALTLYAGQYPQMVRLLVGEFEHESGIRVEVRYGDGPELADRIIREGKRTPADVFFTGNSPELMRLQEQGLLAPVDKATLAQIPARYNSDAGDWIGVLARENVLTYNPKLIEASALPKSILELAMPKWKGKIGVHLAGADIVPLVRTIEVKGNRRAALFWLEGVKLNAKPYPHGADTVLAVNHGDVAVGITNSHDYYRMRQRLGARKTLSRVYHFSNGDPGGLVNISGAAALKYAPHPQLAQKFLAYLVSRPAQALLANGTVDFEYPLRPGVPANKALKPFDQLEPPAITVTQLGGDREARQLLQQAGVL
jgi:iron(III) transport system substrate-binding protein